MILHYDEFCKKHNQLSEILSHYHKLPQQLHLMNNEDILAHINRFGATRVWRQQSAVVKYLKWIHKEYDIDMTDKIFDLQQLLKQNEPDYLGFFSLDDLIDGIDEALMTLETSDNKKATADYDGLIAMFYLEWFGVEPKSLHTIMLEDVTDMGRKVYVPAEKRTVEITDIKVANYLWEYKNKTGSTRLNCKVETSYKGDAFFRTTKDIEDVDVYQQIANSRYRFIQSCGDIRFAQGRLYTSGRYYAMLMIEQKENIEFTMKSEYYNIIRDIFNKPNMKNQSVEQRISHYHKYKNTYMERL